MRDCKFKKDQHVFLLHGVSRPDFWRMHTPKPAVVEKVGAKYVIVKPAGFTTLRFKFDLTENYRQVSDYTPDTLLFSTKQEADDYILRAKLMFDIRQAVKRCYPKHPDAPSLEQLKQIAAILNIEEDPE